MKMESSNLLDRSSDLHMGTAPIGCSSSEARRGVQRTAPIALGGTAEGGCPHI